MLSANPCPVTNLKHLTIQPHIEPVNGPFPTRLTAESTELQGRFPGLAFSVTEINSVSCTAFKRQDCHHGNKLLVRNTQACYPVDESAARRGEVDPTCNLEPAKSLAAPGAFTVESCGEHSAMLNPNEIHAPRLEDHGTLRFWNERTVETRDFWLRIQSQ